MTKEEYLNWVESFDMDEGRMSEVRIKEYSPKDTSSVLLVIKGTDKCVGVLSRDKAKKAVKNINEGAKALESLDKKWALLHIKSDIPFHRNVSNVILQKIKENRVEGKIKRTRRKKK